MFHGSMVALVTPMNEDGSLNREALEGLVEFHVEAGTDAIVAVGTTGESATLDVSEHCAVVRQVVACARGRVPVIAGTGANATAEAVELTRLAMEAGADACLLVTPYYNKPIQEGLYRHFKAVADAVPIPQILYNVPGRTGVDLLPETVARLAPVSNIVGLKEATGEVERVPRLLELCGDRLDLYSGEDPTSREFMLAGGRGSISVTANVAPAAMHAMCQAAVAGDRDAAEAAEAPIRDLHRALFVESNPIPVKWALYEMGRIPPGIRLPLTPLSEMHREPLRRALQAADIPLTR
ncbi:dihydrodipicolinate synthase [Ectothiorhodospira mobilis]|uniref:4-hydroxy-tetrahydrodipicolinate synthase n=1 Tax=Ectothiorhodospira mobilis TaxID=195064 RepID=A0A1I4SL12_ECTMO|nr:4-hydroxy-tetrahydrodipicolinate synthase [Ectothiorhodospira mobilis]SFM65112.1 dihydrodipicolinate synthase [Ectothiorhodospira mobilis]